MKKVLLVALLFISVNAEMLIGVNVGAGSIKTEVTTPTVNEQAITGYTTVIVKVGYESELYRVLAAAGTDKYNAAVVIEGESNANYISLEADYKIDNFYAGIELGTGAKDFIVTKSSFKDISLKTGILLYAGDGVQGEAGLQIKNRTYESYSSANMDDTLIGVFVGINFML